MCEDHYFAQSVYQKCCTIVCPFVSISEGEWKGERTSPNETYPLCDGTGEDVSDAGDELGGCHDGAQSALCDLELVADVVGDQRCRDHAAGSNVSRIEDEGF